ncbi:MAG: TetR/AcrR family transcriptional regulator [Hyphomicrobiaceae bacterium]
MTKLRRSPAKRSPPPVGGLPLGKDGGLERSGRRVNRKPRARPVGAEARREAILKAALAVFSERGFAAARLDDVAAKANVAKGTVYLYFPHKEALFEALVRGAVSPLLTEATAAAARDLPLPVFLRRFFDLFRTEVLGTERRFIVRLVLAEGTRFPAIAEFYHREVVSRAMALMRTVAEQAVRRGELSDDAVVRFPQLIVAPLLVAVLWDGLFGRFEPLDVEGLLDAHTELLTQRKAKP